MLFLFDTVAVVAIVSDVRAVVVIVVDVIGGEEDCSEEEEEENKRAVVVVGTTATDLCGKVRVLLAEVAKASTTWQDEVVVAAPAINIIIGIIIRNMIAKVGVSRRGCR